MLTDRSRIEQFQVCPRSRFWGYEHEGLGIARSGQALPLLNGIALHKALEGILKGEHIDTVCASVFLSYAAEVREKGIYGVDDSAEEFLIREQSTLMEGLIRGWALYRMPAFLDRYEIKAIEQEFPFDLGPGVTMMMRMDLVVRRKSDGMLFIPDFKSTSSAGSYWSQSFRHNNQVNSYILAAQETIGERVGGMVIEGLIKGQWKEDQALSSPFHGRRIQMSPFCYGFMKGTPGGEGFEVQAEYTSRKGFRKIATWDHFSVAEWMDIMGSECVRDQFVTMEIPAPEMTELEDFREEVVNQELKIQEGSAAVAEATDDRHKRMLLNLYFPKTRTACFRFGSECSFAMACYDQTVGSDPIGSGLYKAREPHHTQEEMEMAK